MAVTGDGILLYGEAVRRAQCLAARAVHRRRITRARPMVITYYSPAICRFRGGVCVSRAQRLLELTQVLRRHGHPVSAAELAEATGVSLSTVQSDIRALKAQGAVIEGDTRTGFLLKPDATLPPLIFTHEEIEALMLGARWVQEDDDSELADAASAAIAKMAVVMGPRIDANIKAAGLVTPEDTDAPKGAAKHPALSQAISREQKLRLAYSDGKGRSTNRTVWPIAYSTALQALIAWCEMRRDYRQFRLDRIVKAELLDTRYPRQRQTMLREWYLIEGTGDFF
jgi:predicted DNA-binding transcriptional regulator YafY